MKTTITIQALKDHIDARFLHIQELYNSKLIIEAEKTGRMTEISELLVFINQKLDEE